MVYVISCVCVFFASPPFFFKFLISFGGQIETTREIRLDKKHKRLARRKCRVSFWLFSVHPHLVCVCVCVSDHLTQKIRIEKKNLIEKKKSEEIGWNAIRHRLLPPSLILQKSHFRRFSPGNNFFFLNSSRRKMCQMVITISNQVCKYICRPSCVWKKSFSISQS